MELPIELKEKIEEEISNMNVKTLKQSAKNVSERYRDKTSKKTSNKLITCEEEAIAYAASRMPATYGAIYTTLKHCIEILRLQDNNVEMENLLDVGAGTGAASWASSELLDIKNITCIENEEYMMNAGKILMQAGNKALQDSKWIQKNLLIDDIQESADLVIVSYVLNEISEQHREKVLQKLLNATNKVLLIIEPGTPEGYKEIKEIRKYFIEKGEKILAPCSHEKECKIQEGDWCSFSCRVARSKIHKILKDGDAPYEDEKFSYIAISKIHINQETAVILRHPKIENGKITFKLCTNSGNIEEKIITKKDKELFKKVKKLNCGDTINI